MTTTHNHDVTLMQFIPRCDIPLLSYKTEKLLPTQQNNFPRCPHVEQNKATFPWNRKGINNNSRKAT